MRGLIIIFFCLFFSFASAQDRRKFYISSSTGNDANDGSISAPLKSIYAVAHNNVEVYLKCGDIFYETVDGFQNSLIASYGEGEKPIICGFKILKNPNAWEKIGENLWRLDMCKYENFGGVTKPRIYAKDDITKFNQKTELLYLDNVGFIYDAKNGTLYGRMRRSIEKFERDWDFFVTNIFDKKKIKKDSFRYLYVRLSHNPSKDAALCFPVHRHAIFWNFDCEISDLSVRGFSRHGISHATNSKFINLDVDMIGGSLQLGHPRYARYGNGVEFWIDDKSPRNNNLVENCVFSRTYDCGATIQGRPKSTNAQNIIFKNNKFYRCRQAFEHFLTDTTSYDNCEFSNNLCFEMGNNEFSSPEPRDANLLSYDKKPNGMKIFGNVFFDANHYCGRFNSNAIRDNLVFIRKGQYLSFTYYKKQSIIFGEQNALEKYMERSTETTSKFIELNDENYDAIKRKYFYWVDDVEKRIRGFNPPCK